MGKWILSVFSIVILSTIITILLPEGKTTKYIKYFFGLIIILVIVQPILTLDYTNLSINFENNQEIFYQDNYLSFVNQEKINLLENDCIEILEKKGFKNLNVNINYNVDEITKLKIDFVEVNLKNAVYTGDFNSIDIIDNIIKPLCEYLNIDEKQVTVIE